MIFLTVGTHEPFDRLVRCVDDWCAGRGGGSPGVFGQITTRAQYRPQHFEAVATVEPGEFAQRCETADFIISHAGMGSIITALSKRKPIVVLPRRGHLQETRNDHQFATVERFRARPGIFGARDEAELHDILNRIADGDLTTGGEISPFAEERLLGAVRDFIAAPAKKR